MRTLFVVLILAFPVVAAPIPKEAKRTPLEQLQGKWIIVSIDKGEGPIVPEGDFATYTLTIDGIHISTATAMSSALSISRFSWLSRCSFTVWSIMSEPVLPGSTRLTFTPFFEAS